MTRATFGTAPGFGRAPPDTRRGARAQGLSQLPQTSHLSDTQTQSKLPLPTLAQILRWGPGLGGWGFPKPQVHLSIFHRHCDVRPIPPDTSGPAGQHGTPHDGETGRQQVQSRHHRQAPAQLNLGGLLPHVHTAPHSNSLPSSYLAISPNTRGPSIAPPHPKRGSSSPATKFVTTLPPTHAQGRLHPDTGPERWEQALSFSCKQLA